MHRKGSILFVEIHISTNWLFYLCVDTANYISGEKVIEIITPEPKKDFEERDCLFIPVGLSILALYYCKVKFWL